MLRGFLILALCFSTQAFAKTAKPAKASKLAKVTGIRVEDVSEGSALQLLGLQKGDLIKKINGADPVSLESLSSRFAELKYSEPVDIVVVRKGKKKTLHYVQD